MPGFDPAEPTEGRAPPEQRAGALQPQLSRSDLKHLTTHDERPVTGVVSHGGAVTGRLTVTGWSLGSSHTAPGPVTAVVCPAAYRATGDRSRVGELNAFVTKLD